MPNFEPPFHTFTELCPPSAPRLSDDAPAPKLEPAALHGLAGELVEHILPHTEAHPAALLVNFLAGFGSMAGRNRYTLAGNSRHYANLFAVLAGLTSKGRKGTSWNCLRPIFQELDPDWMERRIVSGLVSGEGVIYHIRDPRYASPDAEEPVDEGVRDKRLFVIEEEFSGPLKTKNRESNTLSGILRAAWDGVTLSTLAKNSPNVASDPHVSVAGHITRDEANSLLRYLDGQNGFANRFLWVYTERSKCLPDGGEVPLQPIAGLLRSLAQNLDTARWSPDHALVRDAAASERWHAVYPKLSEGEPGLYGAVVSRAEAHVVRLSLVYALVDGAERIGLPHLEAALALWRYCAGTARWIFGTACNHPDADKLYEALKERPEGLGREQIRNEVFSGHRSSADIDVALHVLRSMSVVVSTMVRTEGRSREVWRLTNPAYGMAGMER